MYYIILFEKITQVLALFGVRWVTLILESEMLALGWRIQSISSENSKKEFEKHR
jgi:hypothetical protein